MAWMCVKLDSGIFLKGYNIRANKTGHLPIKMSLLRPWLYLLYDLRICFVDFHEKIDVLDLIQKWRLWAYQLGFLALPKKFKWISALKRDLRG